MGLSKTIRKSPPPDLIFDDEEERLQGMQRTHSPAPSGSAFSELVDRAKRRRSVIYSVVAGEGATRAKPKWTAWQLRTPVMIANIVILVVLAAMVEVLLKVNERQYGWRISEFYAKHSQLHVVWTVVPALFIWILALQWYEVDRVVKLLQPYVGMFSNQGKVPAEKSVMLNYAGRSNILVTWDLWRYRHITAFLTNLVSLICISLTPLAGGWLYSRSPPPSFVQPISNITVVETPGFQDPYPYNNLDAAAGFMKSASLFNISPPPFVRFVSAEAWTSTRVSLQNFQQDGTVKAHTVCLQSSVLCVKTATVSYDPSSTTLSGATSDPCTFQFTASDSQGFSNSLPFGVALASCPSAQRPSFQEMSPVVFWALPTNSTPVATVCTPTIMFHQADVLLNTTSSALLQVSNEVPLMSNQTTGIDQSIAPFNGSAYNGLFFGNTPNVETQLNLNSTRYSLGVAIASAFQKLDPTLSNADTHSQITADVYSHYLGMIGQQVYFTPVANQHVPGWLHLTADRLFVSPLITHLLAAIFLVMALCGIAILLLHRGAERYLYLTSEPGTLAAAVALGGTSALSEMVDGNDTVEEMRAILADLHFGIDPATGRLRVEEAETGYADVPHAYNLDARTPKLQKFSMPPPRRSESWEGRGKYSMYSAASPGASTTFVPLTPLSGRSTFQPQDLH